MELIKNKKGIFFTAIMITIVAILIASYTFTSQIDERKTVQKRIRTMNSFITSLEEDMSRKLFTSGFRAIFIFENKIVESGSYITDLEGDFQELFFNGTLNEQAEELMAGATLPDIENDMNNIAQKINVDVKLNNTIASIDQIDPWNIRVTITTELKVEDKNKLASWNKTLISSGFIPTYYFDDPVYTINTGGLINKKVNQTIYETYTAETLLSHTESGYYQNSTEAPSFLDRMKGLLNSNSPYGVESLVNTPELAAQGFTIPQKSIVDHIYFSASNPEYCNVQGMPSWFRLDTPHLSIYQALCSGGDDI